MPNNESPIIRTVTREIYKKGVLLSATIIELRKGKQYKGYEVVDTISCLHIVNAWNKTKFGDKDLVYKYYLN